MQEPLVKVICDTSFLIHLATRRITNIDRLYEEIGQITFVVPQAVRDELSGLQKDPSKNADVLETIRFARTLETVPICGMPADDALLRHVSSHRGIIATMDQRLKKKIKAYNCSIMSFSGNRIVLEQ